MDIKIEFHLSIDGEGTESEAEEKFLSDFEPKSYILGKDDDAFMLRFESWRKIE